MKLPENGFVEMRPTWWLFENWARLTEMGIEFIVSAGTEDDAELIPIKERAVDAGFRFGNTARDTTLRLSTPWHEDEEILGSIECNHNYHLIGRATYVLGEFRIYATCRGLTSEAIHEMIRTLAESHLFLAQNIMRGEWLDIELAKDFLKSQVLSPMHSELNAESYRKLSDTCSIATAFRLAALMANLEIGYVRQSADCITLAAKVRDRVFCLTDGFGQEVKLDKLAGVHFTPIGLEGFLRTPEFIFK